MRGVGRGGRSGERSRAGQQERADTCSWKEEGRVREEDEGKTDILVCPIKRMVIGSLQKLTEWYFSKRNDSFNGILCNRDLLMVFFRNDDLSML